MTLRQGVAESLKRVLKQRWGWRVGEGKLEKPSDSEDADWVTNQNHNSIHCSGNSLKVGFCLYISVVR